MAKLVFYPKIEGQPGGVLGTLTRLLSYILPTTPTDIAQSLVNPMVTAPTLPGLKAIVMKSKRVKYPVAGVTAFPLGTQGPALIAIAKWLPKEEARNVRLHEQGHVRLISVAPLLLRAMGPDVGVERKGKIAKDWPIRFLINELGAAVSAVAAGHDPSHIARNLTQYLSSHPFLQEYLSYKQATEAAVRPRKILEYLLSKSALPEKAKQQIRSFEDLKKAEAVIREARRTKPR